MTRKLRITLIVLALAAIVALVLTWVTDPGQLFEWAFGRPLY